MRRYFLGALIGLLAAATPSAAAVRYVGFGDSIAAGSSWPASCMGCPAVFDCTGGCAASAVGREKCGWVRRLDNWVGSGDLVKNAGVGAETTTMGLGRIDDTLDNTCGTPGNCVAVIAMEGTNDRHNGVPISTSVNNIKGMIDIAEGRAIDFYLLTIIKRVYDQGNASWQSYNDQLLGLATSKKIVVSDVHSSLCPNAACFDLRYWVMDESPCFDPDGDHLIGHLDPDGYSLLFDNIIKPVINVSAPGAPTTTSPTGTLPGAPCTASPNFTWPHSNNIRWYNLDVNGVQTWHKWSSICSGGTCSVNRGSFGHGNHTWRLRGRNLRNVGPWTANVQFSVDANPATPTAQTPTGDQYSNTQSYTWDEAANATDYELLVETGAGAEVHRQTYSSAAASCSGTCTVTPPDLPGPDDYRWQVRAINSCMTGAWSALLNFTVYPETPAVPTPLDPVDHTFDTTPTFRWTESSGADEYDVEEDPPGTPVTIPAACDGGQCWGATANTLSIGMHDWRIKARNPVPMESAFSSDQAFEVLDCASYPDQDLTGTAILTEHIDVCDRVDVAMAASYTVSATGDVTVHTSSTGKTVLHDGFTVDSGGSFVVVMDPP